MASEPQPLDAVPLIRRKGGGEGDPEASPPDAGVRMKPRATVQLAAVHVRIPEQLARGLRLMSVLENRQTQAIVAEAIERTLNQWNPNWREIVR